MGPMPPKDMAGPQGMAMDKGVMGATATNLIYLLSLALVNM